MSTDPAVTLLYDRERTLRTRLNAFLHQRLHLPERDYYADLDQETLAELKSVLSDINNIFTLQVCLGFAQWLSKSLDLDDAQREKIENSILRSPPNANGYDVELHDPISVIAEVKCNVPINGGAVYGSAQRNGIAKDVESLVLGKKKTSMAPNECLKFLVLLDTPNIRKATEHFFKNMKQHKDRIVFVTPSIRPNSLDKVYVVHVTRAA